MGDDDEGEGKKSGDGAGGLLTIALIILAVIVGFALLFWAAKDVTNKYFRTRKRQFLYSAVSLWSAFGVALSIPLYLLLGYPALLPLQQMFAVIIVSVVIGLVLGYVEFSDTGEYEYQRYEPRYEQQSQRRDSQGYSKVYGNPDSRSDAVNIAKELFRQGRRAEAGKILLKHFTSQQIEAIFETFCRE